MGPSLRARELVERFNRDVGFADAVPATADALALQWPELDGVLPDHGLPQGVVEVRAAHALGGGTSIALASIRAAHERDARAWCAWVDPDGTLYSPGVAMSGVDLNRLALVRPPRADLLRIAIKMARSQAFEVIVLDIDPSPGSAVAGSSSTARRKRPFPLDVFVRKIALLAAEGGATVILLTDATVHRSIPLPVALRLELARTPNGMGVRVGKERHGRVGLAKTVSWSSRPRIELAV